MYDKYDVSMLFDEINSLSELSLLRNDSLFHDQYFLQTTDTAIRKNYAHNFANIVIENLEDKTYCVNLN